MAPSRRVLLRSTGLVLAGLGGCAAGYEPPPRPESEECPDSPRMPDADPHPDGADLPPVPDPPAELDEASAVAYAEAFELAREWRATTATYDGPVTKVRTEATTRASRVDDEAVLVELPAGLDGCLGSDLRHRRVVGGCGRPPLAGQFEGFGVGDRRRLVEFRRWIGHRREVGAVGVGVGIRHPGGVGALFGSGTVGRSVAGGTPTEAGEHEAGRTQEDATRGRHGRRFTGDRQVSFSPAPSPQPLPAPTDNSGV